MPEEITDELTVEYITAQEAEELKVLKQITVDILQLENQFNDEGLGNFLEDIRDTTFTEPNDVETEVEPVDTVARTYTDYQIEETLNNRTYRTRLRIDNTFERTSRDRIHNTVVTMIQRLLVGKSACFLRRVRDEGSLIWERPKSRPL